MFKQLSNQVRVARYKMPVEINLGVYMAGLGFIMGFSKSIVIIATLKIEIKFKVLGLLV